MLPCNSSSIRRTMAKPAAPDRLSELPNSLILEILSLLETKEVVQTTILSKRWKDLWTTVPRLEFYGGYDERFIEGALAKWRGEKIIRFNMVFQENTATDIVDSWLLVPIQRNVEELDVSVGPEIVPVYRPPLPLYTCSFITKLSLVFSDLRVEDNLNVQLSQLKRLKIEHPMYLNDGFMERILCGAPLLEELILFSLDIGEDINIRSTSLKALVVGRCDPSYRKTMVMPNATLGIWAHNLLSLKISCAVFGACVLDVPSLNDAVICFQVCDEDELADIDDDDHLFRGMIDHFFRSLRHVEKLKLSDLSIQMLIDRKVIGRVPQFSDTKFVKLRAERAEGFLDVIGMFPELTSLVIELHKKVCSTLDRKKLVAVIDACTTLASKMRFPNPLLLKLKTVEITWSTSDASIILPMVQLLLENAVVLEKLVLRLDDNRIDMRIFTLARNKLLSMPRSSPAAEVFISILW